jgi:tetratricopeptide (TPR) repeat protein
MAEAKSDEVVRLLKRGLNHYGLGDVEAAIASWEEARRLDPENSAVRDYLETAYEELGRSPSSPAPSAKPAQPVQVVGEEDDTPHSLPEASTPPSPAGSGPESTTRTGPTDRAGAVAADRSDESFEARFSSLFEDEGSGDPETCDTLLQGALEAYRDGQVERAWEELDRAARSAPDRLDLRAYQELIRKRLMEGWGNEIGDQGRTLALKLELGELLQRDLQPDEGFLVSQIDGVLTIENLISLSTLDRFRTLQIVARLLREGIVE